VGSCWRCCIGMRRGRSGSRRRCSPRIRK
jgi:hypothetical protein